MKLALVAVMMMFSTVAFADAIVCGRMITCGSYQEGPDDEGTTLTVQFLETDNADQVRFEWIYAKGNEELGGVRLLLTFQNDGSFVAKRDGQLYAAGTCAMNACTYGIIPITQRDGTLIAQTGTFRFIENALEVAMFAPNLKDGDFSAKSTLRKLD